MSDPRFLRTLPVPAGSDAGAQSAAGVSFWFAGLRNALSALLLTLCLATPAWAQEEPAPAKKRAYTIQIFLVIVMVALAASAVCKPSQRHKDVPDPDA